MEKTRIKSISESMSMQPRIWQVGRKVHGTTIAYIKEGTIYDTGDPFDAYFAYDQDGNVLVKIRQMCATVEYEVLQDFDD